MVCREGGIERVALHGGQIGSEVGLVCQDVGIGDSAHEDDGDQNAGSAIARLPTGQPGAQFIGRDHHPGDQCRSAKQHAGKDACGDLIEDQPDQATGDQQEYTQYASPTGKDLTPGRSDLFHQRHLRDSSTRVLMNNATTISPMKKTTSSKRMTPTRKEVA